MLNPGGVVRHGAIQVEGNIVNVGLDERWDRVVGNGQNGDIVHRDQICLLIEGRTLVHIQFRVGAVAQCIDTGITVTKMVHPHTGSKEHGKQIVRIGDTETQQELSSTRKYPRGRSSVMASVWVSSAFTPSRSRLLPASTALAPTMSLS